MASSAALRAHSAGRLPPLAGGSASADFRASRHVSGCSAGFSCLARNDVAGAASELRVDRDAAFVLQRKVFVPSLALRKQPADAAAGAAARTATAIEVVNLRNVVALNDPVFNDVLTHRDEARRVRREKRSARCPNLAALSDSRLRSRSNPPRGQRTFAAHSVAASSMGLEPPPEEEEVMTPPPPPAPNHESAPKSATRIAALQALLGGELIVERHNKAAPLESPWLQKSHIQRASSTEEVERFQAEGR